jgi:hypothetical protein
MRHRVFLSNGNRNSTGNIEVRNELVQSTRSDIDRTSERVISATNHHLFWRVVGYGSRVGRPRGLLTGW